MGTPLSNFVRVRLRRRHLSIVVGQTTQKNKVTMVEYEGSYERESAEGYEEFLKELDVSWPLRKAATASTPVFTVSKAGDEGTFKTSTMLKSMELKFTLGKEFEETTPDGREVSAIVTQEGDKFISVQTAKKAEQKSTKVTREFFDDKCVQTYEIVGSDLVCTQVFKRK